MRVYTLGGVARSPILNLRLDDETRAAWQAAADTAGEKLATFVKQVVNERVAGPLLEPLESLAPVEGAGPVVIQPDRPLEAVARALSEVTVKVEGKTVAGTVRKKGPRKELCLHRVGPESYCHRCDG